MIDFFLLIFDHALGCLFFGRVGVDVVVFCGIVLRNVFWSLSSAHTKKSFWTMVSIIRYVRNVRRTGIKEWWHRMQYIGDAKAGTLKGTDQ